MRASIFPNAARRRRKYILSIKFRSPTWARSSSRRCAGTPPEKAFTEALATLSGRGIAIEVTVDDSAAQGTLATIRLSGADGAAAAEAGDIMAAYIMRHDIVRNHGG